MTKNALLKLGFKNWNDTTKNLYLEIRSYTGVEISIYVDFDENPNGLISLDYDHENGITSVPMPNIRTIYQLKTFTNDNN